MTDPREAARRQVGWWLLFVALLVFCMVVVGGITRLTNSGLSMVEWRPVTGWLPPLSEAAWQEELEKYRQFPEYQKINRGMSLDEFRAIYWWEYGHRLFGRIIGLVFLLPFLFFLLTRRIATSEAPGLLLLFLLGGAQGALGWFMVKSGLVDHPDVSHYRLTAHLGLAVLIFALLLWQAMNRLTPARRSVRPEARLRAHADLVIGLVGLQILSGGLVAGLDAGHVFNTWPLMNGALLPDDFLHRAPWWLNFLESHGTVQFTHRTIAYMIVAAVAALWWRARGSEVARRTDLLLGAMLCQVLLGVTTLLLMVPVALGALHQAGALILLAAALWLRHGLRSPLAGGANGR
ncbi:MAG: COX15/CtaA family protein [Alphaproteobacteria bacterium]|nr:COX15/CtaA family protein [Alphaproteobacteria bacterium]